MKTINELTQREKNKLLCRMMNDYDRLQERMKQKEKIIQEIINSS